MRRLLLVLTLFATAFGFVEGAVVVYLRHIAYPDGFAFPLREIDPSLFGIEVAREAATLVLLLAVALLATRGGLRRFAVFAFCFGVWDLVYYAALKICLGWPASLLDWDVLFLIPVPWIAPVLAPVLVSLALIGASTVVLTRPALELRALDWAVEVLAGALVLASFFWCLPSLAEGGTPRGYPWWLFLVGWLVGVVWFGTVVMGRAKKAQNAAVSPLV